jgi:hypothetical protein
MSNLYARHAVRIVLWLVLSYCLLTKARGAEPYIIIANDGRVLVGQLDAATDAQSLWVRRELPGMQLRSAISWSEIQQVQHQGQALALTELKQQSSQHITPAASIAELAAAAPEVHAVPVEQISQFDNKVVTLQIEATLANWDNDPQTDGLEVVVVPLNKQRQLVPIHGQIDLKLTGFYDPWNHARRQSFDRDNFNLAQSTHLVRPADFANGPAVYQLEFRNQHPENMQQIVPLGLLQARLGVAGQGVFEASQSDVCLQPVSYIRDQLKFFTGQRGLPSEQWLRVP